LLEAANFFNAVFKRKYYSEVNLYGNNVEIAKNLWFLYRYILVSFLLRDLETVQSLFQELSVALKLAEYYIRDEVQQFITTQFEMLRFVQSTLEVCPPLTPPFIFIETLGDFPGKNIAVHNILISKLTHNSSLFQKFKSELEGKEKYYSSSILSSSSSPYTITSQSHTINNDTSQNPIRLPLPLPALPFSFNEYIMSPLPSPCCCNHFTSALSGSSSLPPHPLLRLKDAIVIGGGVVGVDRAQPCLARYNVDIFRISEALEIKLMEVGMCEFEVEEKKKKERLRSEREKLRKEKSGAVHFPVPSMSPTISTDPDPNLLISSQTNASQSNIVLSFVPVPGSVNEQITLSPVVITPSVGTNIEADTSSNVDVQFPQSSAPLPPHPLSSASSSSSSSSPQQSSASSSLSANPSSTSTHSHLSNTITTGNGITLVKNPNKYLFPNPPVTDVISDISQCFHQLTPDKAMLVYIAADSDPSYSQNDQYNISSLNTCTVHSHGSQSVPSLEKKIPVYKPVSNYKRGSASSSPSSPAECPIPVSPLAISSFTLSSSSSSSPPSNAPLLLNNVLIPFEKTSLYIQPFRPTLELKSALPQISFSGNALLVHPDILPAYQQFSLPSPLNPPVIKKIEAKGPKVQDMEEEEKGKEEKGKEEKGKEKKGKEEKGKEEKGGEEKGGEEKKDERKEEEEMKEKGRDKIDADFESDTESLTDAELEILSPKLLSKKDKDKLPKTIQFEKDINNTNGVVIRKHTPPIGGSPNIHGLSSPSSPSSLSPSPAIRLPAAYDSSVEPKEEAPRKSDSLGEGNEFSWNKVLREAIKEVDVLKEAGSVDEKKKKKETLIDQPEVMNSGIISVPFAKLPSNIIRGDVKEGFIKKTSSNSFSREVKEDEGKDDDNDGDDGSGGGIWEPRSDGKNRKGENIDDVDGNEEDEISNDDSDDEGRTPNGCPLRSHSEHDFDEQFSVFDIERVHAPFENEYGGGGGTPLCSSNSLSSKTGQTPQMTGGVFEGGSSIPVSFGIFGVTTGSSVPGFWTNTLSNILATSVPSHNRYFSGVSASSATASPSGEVIQTSSFDQTLVSPSAKAYHPLLPFSHPVPKSACVFIERPSFFMCVFYVIFYLNNY
jgi:hypothetical protein